jgi:hypothetical protein
MEYDRHISPKANEVNRFKLPKAAAGPIRYGAGPEPSGADTLSQAEGVDWPTF